MEGHEQVDVMVVGAGPTGLMLANELALAGMVVEVIERQAAPSGQSRAGGGNPRTAEVLAMRGLLDAVAKHAIPKDSIGWHFAGLPVPLDARPWRTRYPDGVLVRQHQLEETLEEHLRSRGCRVRRSTELTGVRQDDTGVHADVSSAAGEDMLTSRYLVACDGAHSTVRKLTGVGLPGAGGDARGGQRRC